MSVTSAADPTAVVPIIDEPLRAKITAALAGTFGGDIIGPDDESYARARLVWNAMIDRRPGLILRCASTADVVAAVNVAREARAGTRGPLRRALGGG